MKNLFYLLIPFVLVIYSCDDDDKHTPTIPSATEYFPLETGNYWIYDIYEVYKDKGQWVERKPGDRDTLIVGEPKLINGKQYYSLLEKGSLRYLNRQFPSSIRVDSLGYIIYPSIYFSETKKEFVWFSNINFTDVFSQHHFVYPLGSTDTIADSSSKMERLNGSLTYPAGTFNDILNLKETIVKRDKPMEEGSNPLYLETKFAKNVGVIFHNSVYLFGGDRTEYRLVEYKINGVIYPPKQQ